MKTKLALALIIITATLCAAAQNVSVKLKWDPSPDSGVTNYTVYASQSPTFTNNLASAIGWNVGTNLTATATVTAGTLWYYAATATRSGQTGNTGNVVSYIAPTPPAPPANFQIVVNLPPGTTVTSTATNITVTFP